VKDWRSVAAATGPGDREVAQRAVLEVYRRAGLEAPERIVWARSPLEAVRILAGTEDTGACVRETVRNAPVAAERARVHAELGPGGFTEHWHATGAGLWESTSPVVERIRAAVIEEAAATATERIVVRMRLLDAVLGHHDAAWLAPFGTEPGLPLHAAATVAREAGWWWPYEKIAVISERPTDLYRDEAGRLDRGDGPALAYSDGFALFAWRGMPVPAEFLEELTTLTAERIRSEENAELRREMLEYYGCRKVG